MKFKPAILVFLLILAISVLTPATSAQPSQAPAAPGAAAVPGQNPVGRGVGMAALPRAPGGIGVPFLLAGVQLPEAPEKSSIPGAQYREPAR